MSVAYLTYLTDWPAFIVINNDSYHASNQYHFRTKTLVKVVQLKNSQVENDEVHSVNVSCSHKVVVVNQRESQYDGDYQQEVHHLIEYVPWITDVMFESTEEISASTVQYLQITIVIIVVIAVSGSSICS